MQKKEMSLEVANPNAAGIDVGSRSHYVAIGVNNEDVQEFGVYQEDLDKLTGWLLSCGVRTVAMESTGTYWQSLYATLRASGIEVLLANGKFTKNVKGRKTDVQDCQWIYKLHSLGMLGGSFLPDEATEQLRTYCRHRSNLVSISSDITRRMQKYLRLMNLRLDVVVNDICGQTGIKIIEAVCLGEKDGNKLASLRNGNCKKSEEEIAKALQSNGRKDYLFALQQEYAMYKSSQKQISECDKEIEKLLQEQIAKDEEKQSLAAKKKSTSE